MTEEREFEGKDLDEALQQASSRLGIPEADLHYEMLEQGRRGLLGLGVKSVRIRVMPPLDEEPPGLTDRPPHEPGEPARKRPKRRRSKKPARKAEAAEQTDQPPVERVETETSREVEKTVQQMIDLIGLELKVEAGAVEDGVNLQIDGKDKKVLGSRNGELLTAFQFLLSRMSRRTWPEAGRIHLGGDGQTRKRDDELIALAKRAAKQVSNTGKTKKLQPMNAYERRLVHLTVREFAGLTSSSDGNGAMKRVRISKVQNAI